ncbi:MAG: hypothetical protein WDO68_01995 [Gammaproteobacteria bacterium]
MSNYKETWDLTASVLRWGALLMGVACVLQNGVLTGEPPEDPSLGEGLLLYILSVGFFVAYAMFWIGVTAVGLFIMRWPVQWAMRLLGEVPLRALAALPADYKIMWSLPIWGLALSATAIAFFVLRATPLQLLPYLEIAVLQGFGGAMLLIIRRRQNFQSSGLSLTRDKRDTDRAKQSFAEPSGLSWLFGLFGRSSRCLTMRLSPRLRSA